MKVKTIIETLSEYDLEEELIIDWIDKDRANIHFDEAWEEICEHCFEVDFGLNDDWLGEIIQDTLDRMKGKI